MPGVDQANRIDGVHGGAENAMEIDVQTRQRDGQCICAGSDQPDRPVTALNFLSSTLRT